MRQGRNRARLQCPDRRLYLEDMEHYNEPKWVEYWEEHDAWESAEDDKKIIEMKKEADAFFDGLQ